MISSGIKTVLVGILLIVLYSGYWVATFAVYYITDKPVPVTVLDTVMYAFFWIGVALVAVGIVIVIVGVTIEAVTTYKVLRKR